MSEKEGNGNKILFFLFILFLGKTREFLHGETKFLVYGQGNKKIRVGRSAKWKYHLILGLVFFKKLYFA